MRPLLTVLVAIQLLAVASVASALQLQWSSGGSNIIVTEARRCTLVVQADTAEAILPADWRLVWASDSRAIVPIPGPSTPDYAGVCEVQGPQTDGAIATNQSTAVFFSPSGQPRRAIFLFDISANAHGTMRVVALDPSDPESTTVLQSAEVTFNGGVSGELPPMILRTSHLHQTTHLTVDAVGTGLDGLTELAVTSRQWQWRLPLSIESRSDTRITASADLPAALPDAEVMGLGTTGGAAEPVIADALQLPPSTSQAAYYLDPDANIYPKDFAFFYNTVPTGVTNVWRPLFHLYYIRAKVSGTPTDVEFGHAWTSNLESWTLAPNLHAFTISSALDQWDHAHVWAPHVLFYNNKYYMFYTGVDKDDHQSIGYAWRYMIDTTDVDTSWHRNTLPTWQVSQVSGPTGWVQDNTTEFRDPFVIVDPDTSNRLLMLYSAKNKFDGRMAIGVAVSDPGSVTAWHNRGYYRSTDSAHAGLRRAESPSAFPVGGYSGLGDSGKLWRLAMTDGEAGNPDDLILLERKYSDKALADTTLGNWYNWDEHETLFDYLHGDSTGWGWQASEYLRYAYSSTYGGYDYMGGYDGIGIALTRIVWVGQEFQLGPPITTGVTPSRVPTSVRLTVRSNSGGAGDIEFGVEVPNAMPVKLDLYDVAGRHVERLMDRSVPAGRTTMRWDGSANGGISASSGIYFARLQAAREKRVAKVILLR